MALEISGFNTTFDEFVQFAETQKTAGKERAAARDEEVPAMGLPGSGFISV